MQNNLKNRSRTRAMRRASLPFILAVEMGVSSERLVPALRRNVQRNVRQRRESGRPSRVDIAAKRHWRQLQCDPGGPASWRTGYKTEYGRFFLSWCSQKVDRTWTKRLENSAKSVPKRRNLRKSCRNSLAVFE